MILAKTKPRKTLSTERPQILYHEYPTISSFTNGSRSTFFTAFMETFKVGRLRRHKVRTQFLPTLLVQELTVTLVQVEKFRSYS